MISYELIFGVDSKNSLESRIGGGALLGESVEWPKAPKGEPLTLIASLTADMINRFVPDFLSNDEVLSMFSYYSKTEYFLDEITYHGSSNEWENLKKGYTRCLKHKISGQKFDGNLIPAKKITIGNAVSVSGNQSRIGGAPCFLQNENIKIDGRFLLQFYSSDFPFSYSDVFGLPDASAYCFIGNNLPDAGVLFSQVT